MPLPHLTVVAMVEKESFKSTISLASLETSVPEMPMAMPTSAFLRAGASLMPSPVTATTLPSDLSCLTTRIFKSGVLLAMTRTVGRTFANSSSDRLSRYEASTALPPSPKSSSSSAIAVAVTMLSPVSILTSMPAVLQARTASYTSARRGSAMPTNPSKDMPLSASALSLGSSFTYLCANAMTRRARFCRDTMSASAMPRSSSVREQRDRIFSGLPLV